MSNPKNNKKATKDLSDDDSEIDRNDREPLNLSRRMVLGGSLAGLTGVMPLVSADDTSGDSFTAVTDGHWSDADTWESGNVPTDGSHVSIQDGVTVTVAQTITTRVKYLNVAGTLRHAPGQDSKLRVETIKTESGSRYEIGTSSTPIQRGVRAELEFIDEGPIDEDEWPDRKGKGLLAHGAVEVHGATKTPFTTLTSHPEAGDVTVELSEEPTNWRAGDDIVIPGVDPWHSHDGGPMVLHDDERTIAAIDGTTVTLDEPLEHDHVPPKGDLDAYALNLSRNVILTSENESEHRRGHVMIMSTGSDVRYVRFDELGRTNKARPITDPPRGHDELPDDPEPNPPARYPLHWHHTGIEADDPHIVEGAVVNGSPGWGIVNHHAHAHVTDSITYDVLGAGFVAEGGNERGSFERCFALRSEGSGDTIDSRSAGAHGGDPAIDDFGHAGHGFWLQSPLVEVVDNVAAGHRHQAFVWWLRPLLEGDLAEGSDIDDSRVTYYPNLPMEYVEGADPLLEAIDQGRFSNRDELMRETGKIPSTFAPIKRISGNEAFASAGGVDFSRHNFKWKHERFGDFNTIEDLTVYNIGTFVDVGGEEHSPDLPRHRASGHQGRGGNVGVSFRYTSNVTLKDSRIIGSGRENSVGVPFHDYLWTSTVDNCTIENWDWGVDTGEHRLTWVRDSTFRDNEYDVAWTFDDVSAAILDNNDLDLVYDAFWVPNLKASDVLEFSHTRGMAIDGRTVYEGESHPDTVPFPTEDSLDRVNNIEEKLDMIDDRTDLVGLTNAELYETYGICVGGRPMSDDAVADPRLDDGRLDPADPRDPPTAVWLDAEDGTIGDGWSVVDEPEAATGMCLYSEGSSNPPAEHEAASYTFDCAQGIYRLYARMWTDAWNGDTLYHRVDGGDWVASEKLKDPASFKWHKAAERNGPAHEIELDEGEHTIEIAVPNDEVLVDQMVLTSDSTVVGALGKPVQSDDENASSPAVTTDAASNVGETSVTLNGSLDDLGDASSADVSFEWRQTGASSWNATSTQTLSSTGTFSESVSGLEAGVDYEYRAVADTSDGDTATGSSVTFTTTNDPPAITTDSVSNVQDTSATLNGSLDNLGNASSADCYFEYRQSDASSWNTTSKQTISSTGTFSESVSGLEAGVDYEYRAVADASDGDTGTGSSVTFTTADDPPAVTTDSPSNVGDTSATLNGSLDDLGNASSADCYFEYRQPGVSSWNTTSKQTLTSTGTFSADVNSLSSSTDYEYRAVADGSDADSDTGSTVPFSTSGSNTLPSIDSYSVTEAGSPNPHCEITADWSVSDSDGNLDTVEVDVFNSLGLLVDSATTDVSGSTGSGTDKFKIKHVDGQIFYVILTVTDTENTSNSEIQSVSE